MWQKVFENDAFCGIMHETAAEQKESRSPEVPTEIVILFILMSRLLPYETILKAREGDPEAVNAVLLHYAGYIRYFSKVNGQVNAEVEDYVKQRLIDCQFKFRLDEPPDKS